MHGFCFLVFKHRFVTYSPPLAYNDTTTLYSATTSDFMIIIALSIFSHAFHAISMIYLTYFEKC
jgi:hypothetical protein